MTAPKKPSYADLARKVQKLEAQLAAEKERASKAFANYGDALSEKVDFKMRIAQAMAILEGREL